MIKRVGLLFLIGFGAAFYIILNWKDQTSISSELQKRQRTLSRAQAANIKSFFEDFGNSVATFAKLQSLKRMDNMTQKDMESFVSQWSDSGLVGGIVLTDKSGVVRFNANVLGTPEVGTSLVDRDYFLWAKSEGNEGEYFVSQPIVGRLGASKGKMVVVVASPVHKDGIFTGVAASSVLLVPLTKRYLGLMKVSDETQVYLIDQDGSVLYDSSDKIPIKSRIFDFLEDNTIKEGITKALAAKEGGNLQTKDKLVAFSPLHLGKQDWLVAVISPLETDFTSSIYFRLVTVGLLLFLTILLIRILKSF